MTRALVPTQTTNNNKDATKMSDYTLVANRFKYYVLQSHFSLYVYNLEKLVLITLSVRHYREFHLNLSINRIIIFNNETNMPPSP